MQYYCNVMQTEENHSILRELFTQLLVKTLLECQKYKVNIQNGFNGMILIF